MRTKMKTLLVACSILVGCGYRTYPQVPQNNGDPCTFDTFQIDRGASVQLPANAYGITTDGNGWVAAWQGDRAARNFTGSICLPLGCVFEYARFDNATLGDSVSTDGNCLNFD